MPKKLEVEGVDTSAVFESKEFGQTSATVVAVDRGGSGCFFIRRGLRLLDKEAFRKCVPLFQWCSFVQVEIFGLLPGLTKDLPEVFAELKKVAPRNG